MQQDTKYTWITFNRTNLFDACRVGFVAQRIGDLTCDGVVLTSRLGQIKFPFRMAEALVES
jgi:hypothetical protein